MVRVKSWGIHSAHESPLKDGIPRFRVSVHACLSVCAS